MMPARKLSDFDTVIVVARISSSGNAIAAAGELSSQSRKVEVGNEEVVRLQIDEVLK